MNDFRDKIEEVGFEKMVSSSKYMSHYKHRSGKYRLMISPEGAWSLIVRKTPGEESMNTFGHGWMQLKVDLRLRGIKP